MIYQNILDTIGNTPVVRINKLGPPDVELYGKLEAFNPMGSVKDRIGLSMILDAERRGVIKPGDTIVEPTSGNTGIALAMVCTVRGYKLVVTMSESFSIERRKLMKFLGAKVVLTPRELGGSGMVNKAKELADANGWFMPQQFENPSNPEIHRQTTGPEIIRDFAAKRLDYFVSGIGTGGTITGAGEMLKRAFKNIRLIAVEPALSPILSGGKPAPHTIQGMGVNFIPAVLDTGIYDRVVTVTDEESREVAAQLAKAEGIFCGISSGAIFSAALKVAKEAEPGSVILAMLPDTGERYLTTKLFDGITEGSDEVPEPTLSGAGR
ncbi:MAG: cysteine synthase A [Acidobacteria bacterium]|nr:cysteine synthase A [Acidobacteriota bacterium]